MGEMSQGQLSGEIDQGAIDKGVVDLAPCK